MSFINNRNNRPLTVRQIRRLQELPPFESTVEARNFRLQNQGRNSPLGLARLLGSGRNQQGNLFYPNIRNTAFPALNRSINNFRNINNPIYRQRLNATMGNIGNRRNNVGFPQAFGNGGIVAPSVAISSDLRAPQAVGFSLSNSGERNVTFAKEFVGGFLRLEQSREPFSTFEMSTHPSLNASVVAIAQIYQRYKILSYQFKYKAACPTTTLGMHYTGVDYGNQTAVPNRFEEAESLEHFSVGPIWQDSQNWHVLKLANLKERWFSTNINSSDPESRPARIIFGSLGVTNTSTSEGLYGVIEVKVTYLFNGLAQNFTGTPPLRNTVTAPNLKDEDFVDVEK